MKVAPNEHFSRPWHVHGLAADFTLLDVWRFDVTLAEHPGRNFQAFLELHERALARPETGGLSGALFRFREWLGRVFGWDDAAPLAIPGSTECSVAERLSGQAAPADRVGPFQRIYRTEREALYEISNRTVHALMHLGEADGRPVMAVYVKTRGVLSQLYLWLIAPFRHLVVYPAMLRTARAAWARSVTPGG